MKAKVTVFAVFFLTLFSNSVFSQNSRKLEITVSYERQAGRGSNQYAVWIEDSSGKLVKTLYVTRFTAEGGYVSRPGCTPLWVEKADAKKLSKKQVDAISGATPKTGKHTYTWDLTDNEGRKVVPGITSLTMIFGMLPLMFASGVGANGNISIGVGTVGGMLIGTVALLFIVPVLFIVFQYLQERFMPERQLPKLEEKRSIIRI